MRLTASDFDSGLLRSLETEENAHETLSKRKSDKLRENICGERGWALDLDERLNMLYNKLMRSKLIVG